MISSANKTILQIQLVEWFKTYQRPLPWREHYRPYEVWISEMMLQQTQVQTMIPYYHRWMAQFPSIVSVAEAEETVLIKHWEGLGYYSRVRNIQRAAQIMVLKYGGEFPQKFDDILSLPGIGRYTAGAISSIAFNQDQPIVDGNVIRVISRLQNYQGSSRSPQRIQQLWQDASDWIPSGKARFFNQALMELGATVCQTSSPQCLICPVQEGCEARHQGTIQQVPMKSPRRTPTQLQKLLVVFQHEDQILIRRRPLKGLMGGLWEFPLVEIESSPFNFLTLMEEHWGILAGGLEPLAVLRHSYTSFRVTLHCMLYCPTSRISLDSFEWHSRDALASYAFPSVYQRLLTNHLQLL